MTNEELEQLNSKINEMTRILKSMGDEEGIEDNMDIDYNEFTNEFGIDIQKLEEDMKNYNPKLTLNYTQLNDDAVLPSYNYGSDSGFDLYSMIDIELEPLGRALIPTGLSFDIPDGHEIQVRSKSGLAINQGIMCLNSPGTVDSGYDGEIKVIIFNTNIEPFNITKGMKIAQAVLCPVVNGKWVDLVKTDKQTTKERGNNGFGSTGI